MVFDPQESTSPGAKIKVIGVGGGGTNAVSTMIRANIEGVDFIATNTDVQSLRFALAPSKIQIGKDLTKGLGAGADPDIGRDAALEDRHELQEIISGSDMVFVTAGMGGGTGTGGAAIVSQIARENGALTVGVVTKPFSFEGKRRRKHAEIGIQRLKEHVDTLIIIPNDRLLKLATPNLSMLEAFKMADNVLVNAVRGISDIINVPGTINVDFADVKTVMSSMGHALMGIGYSSGENRAQDAATQAISSPLLEDVDIEGATGILINITAGTNVSLVEINEACSIIEKAAHEDANIIFGAVIDESLKEEIRITVIATGFPTSDEEDYVVASKNHGFSRYASPNYMNSNKTNTHKQEQAKSQSFKSTYTPSTKPTASAKTQAPVTSNPEYSEQHFKHDQNNASLKQEPKQTSFKKEGLNSNQTEDEELTKWTMDRVAEDPQVEESIVKEPPSFEPEINLSAKTTPYYMSEAFAKKQMQEEVAEDSASIKKHSSETISSKTDDFSDSENLKMDSKVYGGSLANDSYKDHDLSDFEESEGKTHEPSFKADPPADSSFYFNEQDRLTDDIDKRIDEALELAEKVRTLEKKEDDLDVPAFLRNNPKDLNF